jgi:hypothetical protein
MNTLLPIEISSRSRVNYPDRGYKRSEWLEKVGWKSSLPPLASPCWFRSKWITPDGDLFRSEINTLYLVRNSYTGVVKLEFEFGTQTFDDEDKKWKLI